MKIERSPIGRTTTQVAMGSILQQAASAASFLLLTRGLDAGGYGLFAAMFALTDSLYYFAGFWATPYIVAEGSRQFERRGRLGDIFLWGAAASIIPPLVFLWPTAIIATSLAGTWTMLIVLEIRIAGSSMMNALRCAATIIFDFRAYGQLLWLDRFLLLGLLVVLLILGRFDAVHAIGATAISSLAVALAGIAWLYPRIDFSLREFESRVFVQASWPIILSNAVNYFCAPAFIILWIGHDFGSATAGRIASAFVIAGFLSQPVQWVTPALLPRFAAEIAPSGRVHGSKHLSEMVVPVCAAYAVLAICAALAAPGLPVVLGASFKGAESLAVPVVGAVVADAVNMLIIPLLLAQNRQRIVLAGVSLKTAFFLLPAVFFGRSPSIVVAAFLAASWCGAAVELLFLREHWKEGFALKIGLLAALSAAPGLLYALQYPGLARVCSLAILPVACLILWRERRPLINEFRRASIPILSEVEGT